MPSSPTSTASWFRGEKGWFTEYEEKIMVNRILREDPSKSSMHNREPLTPKLLWQSMKDYDLWPIYILGLNFQTPMSTPANYLTLSLKGLGFDTFKTNLLVIPTKVLHVVTMLGLTYAGEVFGELTFTALIGQLWAFPFLLFINLVDINGINKWLAWGIMTAFLSYPNGSSPLPSTSYIITLLLNLTNSLLQLTLSKSDGTLATPTQCDPAPCPQRSTTCPSKPLVSSPRTFTPKTMHPAISAATASYFPYQS